MSNTQEVITAVFAAITALIIAATPGLLAWLKTMSEIRQIKIEINSRMTELLRVTSEAAHSAGRAAGEIAAREAAELVSTTAKKALATTANDALASAASEARAVIAEAAGHARSLLEVARKSAADSSTSRYRRHDDPGRVEGTKGEGRRDDRAKATRSDSDDPESQESIPATASEVPPCS